jgi:hypothetical protein
VVPLGSFSGPKQLAELLLEAQEIQGCAVQQFLSFALGRSLIEQETGQLLPAWVGAFGASNYDFRSLILDFVADPAFILKAEPTIDEESP